MSLRNHAAGLMRTILNDSVCAMGWPIILIAPDGFQSPEPLVGRSQDIAQIIDPDTGQAVTGRLASASLAIKDIVDAGYPGLPRNIEDTAQKPWRVQFDDELGNTYHFKVVESNPDRTLGNLVLLLEGYKPPAPTPTTCVPTHMDDTFWRDINRYVWVPGPPQQWRLPNAGTLAAIEVATSGPNVGWQIDYRPSTMWITLSAANETSFPFNVEVYVETQGDITIATYLLTMTGPDPVVGEVPLDWDLAFSGAAFTRLTVFVDGLPVQAPDIDCIGFVD